VFIVDRNKSFFFCTQPPTLSVEQAV